MLFLPGFQSKDKERKKPNHGSPTKLKEAMVLKDESSSHFVSPTGEFWTDEIAFSNFLFNPKKNVYS